MLGTSTEMGFILFLPWAVWSHAAHQVPASCLCSWTAGFLQPTCLRPSQLWLHGLGSWEADSEMEKAGLMIAFGWLTGSVDHNLLLLAKPWPGH